MIVLSKRLNCVDLVVAYSRVRGEIIGSYIMTSIVNSRTGLAV